MKKIILCLLMVVMMMSICGCESNEEENKGVFKALKKQGIIDKDYEFVDRVTYKREAFMGDYTDIYYFYENNDGDMIVIYYEDGRDGYDYRIKITEGVTFDREEYETIEASEDDLNVWVYSDGSITKGCRYDWDSSKTKTYNINKDTSLFMAKYTIDEVEEDN